MRLSFADGRDGIAAANILRGRQHRIGETLALLHVSGHEMSHDFGVRFRFKPVPFFLKLLFERQIVFDDAVMNEYAPSGPMGMRILLRRLPMGRPTRMADSGRST